MVIRSNIVSQSFPHFIGSWTLEDKSICDRIVDFFNSNSHLHKFGKTGRGIDANVKNSIDLSLVPNQISELKLTFLESYFSSLNSFYSDYSSQWGFLQNFPDLEIGLFNIQCYLKGGHFKSVHSERTTLSTAHRVFAWMTYLNDEFDGGHTSFVHFNLQIKPKKGLTLLWPAEWTHAHFGDEILNGSKYIITGWLNFKT